MSSLGGSKEHDQFDVVSDDALGLAWWCSKDLFHVHDEALVTKDFF